MLLIDTIKNSTIAIKNYQDAVQNKQHIDAFVRALGELQKAENTIHNALTCAVQMKEAHIISTPLMLNDMREELIALVNDCGSGIADMSLTMDRVRILQSKGDSIAAQLRIVWRDAAVQYSQGPKGYLSLIGGLTDNPQKARELSERIEKYSEGIPTQKAITGLQESVAAARRMTENFAINDNVEKFLMKVSNGNATIFDLQEDVFKWIKDRHFESKFKIEF